MRSATLVRCRKMPRLWNFASHNSYKNFGKNLESNITLGFDTRRRKGSGGTINSSINNNERDYYGRTE